MNTHDFSKDVPLVHMNCDERLKFGSLDLSEVAGGLINEGVEKVKEVLISLLHDLAVIF